MPEGSSNLVRILKILAKLAGSDFHTLSWIFSNKGVKGIRTTKNQMVINFEQIVRKMLVKIFG